MVDWIILAARNYINQIYCSFNNNMNDVRTQHETLSSHSQAGNSGGFSFKRNTEKNKNISLTPSPHKSFIGYFKYPNIEGVEDLDLNADTKNIKLRSSHKAKHSSGNKVGVVIKEEDEKCFTSKMPNFVANYDDLVTLVKKQSEEVVKSPFRSSEPIFGHSSASKASKTPNVLAHRYSNVKTSGSYEFFPFSLSKKSTEDDEAEIISKISNLETEAKKKNNTLYTINVNNSDDTEKAVNRSKSENSKFNINFSS